MESFFINVKSWVKFEDTIGVIKSCKSKDRQYIGQNKKGRKTNSTQKTKYWATWIPPKPGVNSGGMEELAVPALVNCYVECFL